MCTMLLQSLKLFTRRVPFTVFAVLLILTAMATSASSVNAAPGQQSSTSTGLSSLNALVFSTSYATWTGYYDTYLHRTYYDWMDWSEDGCSVPDWTTTWIPGVGDAKQLFVWGCLRHDFALHTLAVLDDGSGSVWNQRNRYAADIQYKQDLYAYCDATFVGMDEEDTRDTCRVYGLEFYNATRIGNIWWPPGGSEGGRMFLINLGIDPAPANIRDDVDDDEDGPRFTDDATFADDRLYVNYIEVNGKPMAPVKMEYLPTQTVFPITVVRGNQQPFQGNRPATGIFTLPWNDAYRTGHVKLTAHWPMKIGESADLDCTGDQVNTAINFDDPGTESDSSTTNSDPFYADDSSITRETVYLIICGGISNEDHPYLELHSWDARYRGPILGGYDLTLGDRLRHYENVKARSMSAYLQGEAGHSSPSVGQFPDNGAWRRLTVSTTSPRVDIVVNPSDTDDPLVEIASSAVTSHYCPPERNDIYHHATNNRVVQLAMCEDGNGTIKVLDSGTGIEFASYTPRGKACGSDINLSAAYVTYSWWSTDCQSTRRSESYVDYYTFTLDADTSVQIDLTSSVDTYLYLIEGAESWGTDYLESDDDDGAGLDSRIERNLSAGTYTVAATTYGQNKIGSYRLRVAED